MTSSKSTGFANGQAAICLAKQMELSKTFLDLDIVGLERLAASRQISRKNKELIFRFLNHISPEVSERRLTFYTHKLGKLASWLRKDFDDITEEDLRSVLTLISKGNAKQNGGKFSAGTVHGYQVTLKRFYRWLEGDDEEYPRKVRWIKTSGDTTRIQEPEQLLTPEEILEMIRHARNPRDKAMVSFLAESGARLSEMLSMRIRHLEFSATLIRATLPVSKTQPRTIPLVACRGHLTTWVNYHPRKNDPEAPLWSNLKRDGGEPLLGQSIGEILKAIASSAGITKRVYPHLFRACSITHKQSVGWPEQAVKAFHGLSKDSKVMKHYSHLSYGNLEDIQRKMNGLPVADSANTTGGVKCPGCGRTNPLFVEMCPCGLPTELKVVPAGASLEAELEVRLGKKMQDFIDSRQFYDRLMERFLEGLLEKSKESPELLKAAKEVGRKLDVRQARADGTMGG